jgi:hypothetical protein
LIISKEEEEEEGSEEEDEIGGVLRPYLTHYWVPQFGIIEVKNYDSY